MVGFSVRSVLLKLTEDINEAIKETSKRLKKKKPMIILGGHHITTNPEDGINFADVVIIGEAEETLLDLCGNKDMKEIKNIWYKKNGKIIKNPSGFVVEYLDKIPYPDYSDKNKWLFNNGKVVPAKLSKYKTRYTTMTQRGCPMNCAFCGISAVRKIYQGKFLRRRSVDNVINGLKKAKEQFPYLSYISFMDDIFTINPEWINEFVIKYKKEIDLPFYCYSHPKFVQEDMIKQLKNAGVADIAMGVQTFSARMRKIYNRYGDEEDIVKATDVFHKYKIRYAIDLILDDPKIEEDDLKTNLKALLRIKPPFSLHLHTMTYLPKTNLTDSYIADKTISIESVESIKQEGWGRWTPSLDLSRDKRNKFYDALYSLTKSRFRSKWLIKKLSQSDYYKENPDKLMSLVRKISTDMLSLNWNNKYDRLKFFASNGIIAILRGDFAFLKVKAKQLMDKDAVIDA
tara:strand:- start:5048 stop:6418 length:1371 start_codon:yes stop_codon:yes gene_type:complete